MRAATVAGLFVVVLLVAGVPGLTGLVPRIENEPWAVTTYAFAYGVDVANFGTAPAANVTVRVALLPDMAPFQRVDRLALDTPGYVVEEDERGNRFAVYRLAQLPPATSFVANVDAAVQVYGIDFAVPPEAFSNGAASADPAYVAPEAFVESSDPRIVARARWIRANGTDLADFVYNAYVWTANRITYETQPKERGALWALKTGRGMAPEYANLYMSLLRAEGVAAKRVNGWGERFQAGQVLPAEEVAHAWVLVDAGDRGWLPVDPTFGDRNRYENFLKMNDRRVILTEGVNRAFYGVTYDRAPGVNVQVDYTVHVLGKEEENLSTARQIVLVGMVSVPVLLAAVLVVQVVRERRRRVYED
jgi:transglutaminase-like putative cysteine protease